MTEFETFMVYELDDSGEKLRLDINEEQLQQTFHPKKVLLIVRDDLRRIFIWQGPESHIRKRFISLRVAQALQEELMEDSRYHRCKIVLLDARVEGSGDLPFPYIFNPPSPPGDLGVVGQPIAKKHITEEIQDNEPYCKHCGSELAKGQSICHVCRSKVI